MRSLRELAGLGVEILTSSAIVPERSRERRVELQP
jgi:hypothetical protein